MSSCPLWALRVRLLYIRSRATSKTRRSLSADTAQHLDIPGLVVLHGCLLFHQCPICCIYCMHSRWDLCSFWNYMCVPSEILSYVTYMLPSCPYAPSSDIYAIFWHHHTLFWHLCPIICSIYVPPMLHLCCGFATYKFNICSIYVLWTRPGSSYHLPKVYKSKCAADPDFNQEVARLMDSSMDSASYHNSMAWHFLGKMDNCPRHIRLFRHTDVLGICIGSVEIPSFPKSYQKWVHEVRAHEVIKVLRLLLFRRVTRSEYTKWGNMKWVDEKSMRAHEVSHYDTRSNNGTTYILHTKVTCRSSAFSVTHHISLFTYTSWGLVSGWLQRPHVTCSCNNLNIGSLQRCRPPSPPGPRPWSVCMPPFPPVVVGWCVCLCMTYM